VEDSGGTAKAPVKRGRGPSPNEYLVLGNRIYPESAENEEPAERNTPDKIREGRGSVGNGLWREKRGVL